MLKRSLLPLFSLLVALLAFAYVAEAATTAPGLAQAALPGPPVSQGNFLQHCYGEADCNGWVYYIPHQLAAPLTLTVYAKIDGNWVQVGSGSAGPSDEPPIVISGDYTQPVPPEETLIGFVIQYRGRTFYDKALKPACSTCTRTPGYWKTHPEAWPVESLVLGSTTYSQAELLAILNTPPRGDATYILAHALIAAKLNIASGTDDSALGDTVADADAWLTAHPIGSDPQGDARQEGIDLAATLDDYNNGVIGPGSCG